MRRIVVDNVNEKIVLLGGDHKYFAVVLRAKIGDVVEVCCGDGFVYDYKVVAISKDRTELAKIGKRKDDTEPKTNLTLFMPVLKGDKNDYVVQKLTELGVKRICPFVSEFSQAKSLKADRLEKIAREAVMQCGRGAMPVIDEVMSFDDALSRFSECDAVVFPYEKEQGADLKSAAQTLVGARNIAIIIGPEGGFSDDEASSVARFAKPVTLGKRILRAETACIVCASIVLYELGELA